MKPVFLIFPRLPASGMAIFPFIIIKAEKMKQDLVLVNHERIHFRQQLELLILPFYFVYLINYLVNLLKYKNHSLAYFNISFEREAYANEQNLGYLSVRKPFSWLQFLSKTN